MGTAYSPDLRERVVRAYNSDEEATYVDVGERFCVADKSVSRWVRLHRETGSIEPKPASGGASKRKIFDEHEQAIRHWYQEQPDLTQQEVADKLLEVYGIQIGQPSICKLLKRMELTRKKKSFRDDRAQRVDVRGAQIAWLMLMTMFFVRHYQRLVWVDESWVGTWMTRTYGYSPKGARLVFTARTRVPANTLAAAMGAQGVVCHQVFPKGMTAKRWKVFVTEYLLPSLPPHSIVMWDNLKIHYDEECLELLRQAGHLVLFTPKYSPEGNPIEYMFNTLKAKLKQVMATTMAPLRQAIADALDAVTPQHVAGYSLTAWGHMYNWQE